MKYLKRFWEFINYEEIIYEGYEGNEHHVYKKMSIKTKLSIVLSAIFLIVLSVRWVQGQLEKTPVNLFIGGTTAFLIIIIFAPTVLYFLPIKILDSLKLKTKQITFGPLIVISVTFIASMSLLAIIILMDAFYF